MEAGDSHIDYSCPVCGKRFRSVAENAGRDARCPECGGSFTIPAPVPAPEAGQPPRSRYADRFGGEPQRMPAFGAPAAGAGGRPRSGGPAEPKRWPNNWAIVWGVALLFSVLMPQPTLTREYPGGYQSGPVEEIRWIFVWTAVGELPDKDGFRTKAIIGLLATIGLGLFAIIAGGKMHARTLGHSLFWASAGTFLLSFLLLRSWEAVVGKIPDEATGAIVVAVFMLLATTLVAAGNHVRKFRPHAPGPRQLAGIGGVVLTVGMLLPVFDGHMMIEGLFEEDPWDEAPALMICCVVFLIFALLSLWSFTPGAVLGLNRTLSILARCIMIGLPVVLLITFLDQGRDPNFGMVFITIMKGFLGLYAPLAIVAVGLAAMMGAGEKRGAQVRPYG